MKVSDFGLPKKVVLLKRNNFPGIYVKKINWDFGGGVWGGTSSTLFGALLSIHVERFLSPLQGSWLPLGFMWPCH